MQLGVYPYVAEVMNCRVRRACGDAGELRNCLRFWRSLRGRFPGAEHRLKFRRVWHSIWAKLGQQMTHADQKRLELVSLGAMPAHIEQSAQMGQA